MWDFTADDYEGFVSVHHPTGFPIHIYNAVNCCEAGSDEPYPEVVCAHMENIFQENLRGALDRFSPEHRALLLGHFERM